ncbi:MAG: Na+/H+ antiporter subunit E [Caldilineales bacterium]|nr:Na+/H+ antiporter subunit E [Caldilineales bacterium]
MQLWMIFGLWLVYLALTSNLEFSNLVVGLLIALGLTALLRPSPYPLRLQRIPGMAWALLRYGIMVGKDVFLGGLQVARFTLDPKLPIHPAVIAIPSGAEAELATALSAHTITLSPGAVVIEIGEQGMMYTHTLDVTMPDEAYFKMQRQRRDLLTRILPSPPT